MIKVAHDIIVRPIITERSMEGLQLKKYTFEVDRTSNKIEIAKAVEELFKVKVLKVNTMNVKGRAKRVGAHAGYKSDWKKAIVTLKPDSTAISFFEGML